MPDADVGTGRPSPSRRAGIAGLAAMVAVAFFLDLGRAYLWDPGESRYAEAAREMLVTGNWIVPTLNFAHYYDKPPAFYWLVAAAFRLFGMNEWAARLPAAVAAVLTIAATVAFGWRRLGAPAALGAGAILATAIEFVVLGRSVRMDMLLTLAMSATLFYAYRLWEGHPPAAATWPLYVLAALGSLVKGPVAVLLPLLVVAVFTFVTGEYERLRRLRPGWGTLAALALAGSWYLVTAVRAPDYLWSFLWRQNVGRFVTGRHAAGHSEPFWFFFWVLPAAFLPWTVFLPGACRRAVRRVRRGDDVSLFLLVWLAVVFVFFTLSRAKLATYILPVFPPLALLVAAYLWSVLRAPARAGMRAFKILALLWIAGMLALAVAVAGGVAIRHPAYGPQAAVALVLLVFPVAGLRALRRGRWRALPVLVTLAALATQALFYRAGVAVVNDFSSLHSAAEVARALPTNTRVFTFKTRGHSFTFYDGRIVTRVRSPRTAAAVLESARPTALLTKTRKLAAIRLHLTEPVYVWWQGPSGRALLANVPPPEAARHEMVPPLAPQPSAALATPAPPS